MRVLQTVLLTLAMVGIAAAGTPSSSVPEIDVSTTVAAVGLLGGVLLVIRSRRKK
jgi:hypothetical protein